MELKDTSVDPEGLGGTSALGDARRQIPKSDTAAPF
jgi:hypothetical protein